MMKNRLSVEQV